MATSTEAPPLLLPMALLLLLLASLHGVRAAPNTAALSVLCNGASYGAGDPFATSLAYVLSELLSATPAWDGHDFYDISPYPAAFAYGHAACRAALTAADWASCLRSAASQMDATCGHSVGARAVLVDCSVRYEQYAFVD
ncbi:antifungal protein ginkbilobin-like protein 1 [Phragmites australis]|uniref:antifungal protein ginkbilobin-like protein 1 n=1 Tax=Phragmites australis TaxID=29695 RepID=UPI002D774D3D|nr:antifungal protein ginkbilobin-like protein 1 [Phragmites australis]